MIEALIVPLTEIVQEMLLASEVLTVQRGNSIGEFRGPFMKITEET